ncbi:MAG: TrmH family RNA methyltransferase [Elusimicrobiota bacterium]
MKITSVQNPRIKSAVRLRDRRGRAQQGRMIIDGRREIERAAAAGVAVRELFICGAAPAPKIGKAEIFEVSPAVFAKLAYGNRDEGLVAVADIPAVSLDKLSVSGNAVVAVLEGVEKPGNVGAVLRTADAAGLAALLVVDGGTDLYNPNTIRASLGAIFTVPVAACDAAAARDWLRRSRFRILAARVDGAIPHAKADYSGRCAIALGSEAAGLTDAWRGEDITAIALPMRGKVDSLNVSAAAAVLFYEATRT